MSLKIDARKFTPLLDELEALRDKVTEAVAEYNEAANDAALGVSSALEMYNAKLAEVRELVEDKSSEVDDYVSEKSEKWLEGERGQAVSSWKDELDNLTLDDMEVDLPEEVEMPDDPVDDLRALPLEPGA